MSRSLIITGMHRSATSLVASMLQRGGVDLGEGLLGPGEGNPRGFFEDTDFYAFHQRALQTRGQTVLVNAAFTFAPTPEEARQAAELIRARAGRALWGWKDPRTSLFLDFWHELLPDAVVLMLYRHPLEVLWSLLRRLEPTVDILEGLDAWQTYNERLLRFREAHPDSCVLCHCYAAVDRPERLSAALGRKLHLAVSLDSSTRDGVYHAAELMRLELSPRLDAAFGILYPLVRAVYERLEARADIPSGPRVGDPGSSPDLEPFERCLAALPADAVSSHARSLLHVLMTCIDRDALERATRRSRAYLREVRTGNLWLEEQRSALKAESEKLAKLLAEQQAWSVEQERAKLALQSEVDRLFTSSQSLAAQLQEQGARSVELEEAGAALRRELASIRSSTRWRLTEGPWRLGRWVAPQHTLRGRALRWVLRGLARFGILLGNGRGGVRPS